MRYLTLLISLAAALASSGVIPYPTLAARAQRAFQWSEWNSAAAMYELLIAQQPDSLTNYSRAIVSYQMMADSAATVDVLERAMAHGNGLAEVLADVRSTDFSIGQGDRYGQYLLLLKERLPWMSRALDNELLRYYDFRNDGPLIVHYARIMLAGLPDSVTYLNQLARGYLLSDRIDLAAETWRHILTIDPSDPTALSYIRALEVEKR